LDFSEVLSREAASSTNLSLSFGRTWLFLGCNRELGSQTIGDPDEIAFCLTARAFLIQSAPTQRGVSSEGNWQAFPNRLSNIDESGIVGTVKK
jgi:hypothetical protein